MHSDLPITAQSHAHGVLGGVPYQIYLHPANMATRVGAPARIFARFASSASLRFVSSSFCHEAFTSITQTSPSPPNRRRSSSAPRRRWQRRRRRRRRGPHHDLARRHGAVPRHRARALGACARRRARRVHEPRHLFVVAQFAMARHARRRHPRPGPSRGSARRRRDASGRAGGPCAPGDVDGAAWLTLGVGVVRRGRRRAMGRAQVPRAATRRPRPQRGRPRGRVRARRLAPPPHHVHGRPAASV